jgi:hypothetical protein
MQDTLANFKKKKNKLLHYEKSPFFRLSRVIGPRCTTIKHAYKNNVIKDYLCVIIVASKFHFLL